MLRRHSIAHRVTLRGVPAIEIIFFILRNMTYIDMLCIALYEPKYKYTLHFYVWLQNSKWQPLY